MIDKLSHFCIRQRLPLVLAMFLSTLALAWSAVHMEVKTVFADLLPTRHAYVKIHNQFKDTFGGSNIVTIMVTAKEGDIFQLPILRKVQTITRELATVPAVNNFQIISLASRKLKEYTSSTESVDAKPMMWPDLPADEAEIDSLRERVLRNDFVLGLYVSRDLRSTLITVDFLDHKVEYGTVFDNISRIVDSQRDATVDIAVVGDPILFGWVNYYLPETLHLVMMTLAVMAVLLFLLIRSWRGVLMPFISGTVSACWALGICHLLGIHFDPLVVVVALLITARTISHSVQVITRFHEEADNIESHQETAAMAARTTLAELFRPGVLGVVVDAACVAVVAISPIPILEKLTLLAVIWILTIAVSASIYTPILLSWVNHPKHFNLKFDLCRYTLTPFLDACYRVAVGRGRYAVLAGTALALVLSGWYATHIKIGDANPGSPILWPDSIYNVDSAAINSQFPGADRMFVVVAGNEPDIIKDRLVLENMNQFQRFMEVQPEIGGTVSLADAVPVIHELLRENNPRYRELGTDQAMNGELLYMLQSVSDPDDLERYMDRLSQNGSVTLFFRDREGATIRTAVARVKEFMQEHPVEGVHYELAGGLIGVLAAVNEVILGDQIKSIAFALLILLIICAVTYRSATAGMFFMLPVILSNTVTFSVMALMDIGMNINTVPVAALGIGLGVDYAFYVCDRIKHELENNLQATPEDAIRVALHSAGHGVLVTAVVLVAGIGLWWASSLRFQAEMGLLIAVWLGVSAFSALYVMPALAYTTRPAFIFGEGRGFNRSPVPAAA